ncbi:hypothetical protein H4Q26_006305 [Puccinia striiformis f. sp. tritici PST-130]|nr:hypothetical protein H4Q26_006305 [Puccinia striiformis f. sp. tritici PST-130]
MPVHPDYSIGNNGAQGNRHRHSKANTPSHIRGLNMTKLTCNCTLLPQSSTPPLLAAGKLVVGVQPVNKRNFDPQCICRHRPLDSDIGIKIVLLKGNDVEVELWKDKSLLFSKKRKLMTINDPTLLVISLQWVEDHLASFSLGPWDYYAPHPPPPLKSKKLNNANVKVLIWEAVSVTNIVQRSSGLDLPTSGFL